MEGGAAGRGKPPEGKKRAAPAARVSNGRREGGSPEGFRAAAGVEGSPSTSSYRSLFRRLFSSLCVALFAALPTAAAALCRMPFYRRGNLRANDTRRYSINTESKIFFFLTDKNI